MNVNFEYKLSRLTYALFQVLINENKGNLYVNKTSIPESETDSKPELNVTSLNGLQVKNSTVDYDLDLSAREINEDLEKQTPNSALIETARLAETQRDEVEQPLTDTTENEVTDISELRFTLEKETDLLVPNITFITEEQISSNSEQEITLAIPSEMDRVTRSLIFTLSTSTGVDNQHYQPESDSNNTSEKENKDIWVPPPNRESRLRKLKENSLFDVRAYRPETSPTKLFLDGDGEEEKTRPHSREFTPEKIRELEGERREIIKRQGQRRSLDIELGELSDETDTSIKAINLNGMENKPNTKDVDTDQINFEAARQQFVMLEKRRNSQQLSPRLQPRTPRLSSWSLNETRFNSPGDKIENINTLIYRDQVQQNESPNTKERHSSELRKQFFWESSLDIVDSGIGKKEKEENLPEEATQESEEIQQPSNETPIEREIRLALEREESLRKERGIQSTAETKEMVEILKNPVLTLPSQFQSEKKSKDRDRSYFFLQREIEKEAQREADLKMDGKVPGFYDKGSIQELDERRKLFEQPDEIPVKPHNGPSKVFTRGNVNEESMVEELFAIDKRENSENWTTLGVSRPYVRTNWKPEAHNNYRSRRQSSEDILDMKASPQPTSTALYSYRFRSQSSENILDINPPPQTSPITKNNYRFQRQNSEEIIDTKLPTQPSAETGREKSAEIQILNKENFNFQPWIGHFRVNGDEEVDGKKQTAIKTEDTATIELYSISRLRPSESNVVKHEIQQTLERDRELKEQRRKSELPFVSTDNQNNTPINGFNQYDKTSDNSGISNQWSSVSQKGKPSYLVSPVQMFKPKIYPNFVTSESDTDRLKKRGDENWYAGIGPSDNINAEIVESTRVNRHKNTMALLWEDKINSNN
ncbi:mitotic interactor and substrate of PLK1 [Bombina bombina]|uniref:mitotic interactor and substrate of PLK1 n=1 Tax=Bombina bombina TaxID=8345 RepID=UPI00235AE4D7|nr:mitotic interactor and substrate of PLK1 [Bombina bombina]